MGEEMAGFVYEDREKIPPFFVCERCSEPLIDPVNLSSTCKKTFCRQCLTEIWSNHLRQCSMCSLVEDPSTIQWTSEGSTLGRYLDELLVQCSQCSKKNLRRRYFLDHHRGECPKRMLFCPSRDVSCPWHGYAEDLRSHQEKCPYEQLHPLLQNLLGKTLHLSRVIQIKERLVSFAEQMRDEEEQSNDLRAIHGQIQDLVEQVFRSEEKKDQQIQSSTQTIERQDKQLEELIERNNQLTHFEEQSRLQSTQINSLEEENQQLTREKDSLDEEFNLAQTQSNEKYFRLQSIQIRSVEELNKERQRCKDISLGVMSLEDELSRCRIESTSKDVLLHALHLHLQRLQARLPAVVIPVEEEKIVGEKRNRALDALIERCPMDSLINLSGEVIHDDDQSMEILLQRAIRDRQCHSLLLSCNSLSTTSIHRLAQELTFNQTLHTLILSHNNLSFASIEFLSQALSINNFTLKQLTLSSNQLDDRSIESISAMLKTNQSLIILGLQENRFSDRSLQHLSQVLQHENQTLEQLFLHSNPSITDLSLPFIKPIFQYNQSLRVFDIHNCQLSIQGKQQLQHLTTDVDLRF